MTALVDGDLSVRSQVTLAGAFAQLRDSVNRTSEYVSAAVGNTQQAVESIVQRRRKSPVMPDLSDRTEQQAANLERPPRRGNCLDSPPDVRQRQPSQSIVDRCGTTGARGRGGQAKEAVRSVMSAAR